MANSIVFEPMTLAGLNLQSHLVRSATAERIVLDNREHADQIGRIYAELARGGVGLIITGHMAVDPTGRHSTRMPGIWSDAQRELWREVFAKAHEAGGVVCAQINHAGGRCRAEDMGPERVLFDAPVCVSNLPDRDKDPMLGRELADEDMHGLVESFGKAARRAKEAGADAVQIHSAHGYLLSQFLSPHTNRRTDGWGGTLEGRARIVTKIVRAVRDAVGEGYPVGMKLGAMDEDNSGGLTVDESIQVAKWAQSDGLDFIEISGGFRSDICMRRVRPGKDEAYYLPVARRFKQALHIPVLSVGGFRSLAVMEEALASGSCDAISLSRPLVRQPDADAALKGKGEFDCIGCTMCLYKGDAETRCYCLEKEPK